MHRQAVAATLLAALLLMSGCLGDDCRMLTSGRWTMEGLYATIVAMNVSSPTGLPPTLALDHAPEDIPDGAAHLVNVRYGMEYARDLDVHLYEAEWHPLAEGGVLFMLTTDTAVDRAALRVRVMDNLSMFHALPADPEGWWTGFMASERSAGKLALTHSDTEPLSSFEAAATPDFDRLMQDRSQGRAVERHTAGRAIEMGGGWSFHYHIDSVTWTGPSDIGTLTLRVDVTDHAYITAPLGYGDYDEQRFENAVDTALGNVGIPAPHGNLTFSQAWCPPD